MWCRCCIACNEAESDGEPYTADVNANCDITIDGGFAKTAKVAGYDYGVMASQIVGWASRRKLA